MFKKVVFILVLILFKSTVFAYMDKGLLDLYKIKASVASWVRIYCDVASRDSDATRSHGNDPLPGSGVIAEVTTTSADEEILLTPGVMGFNNDSSVSTNIYLAINNRSGSAAAVTVTLTVLKIGE